MRIYTTVWNRFFSVQGRESIYHVKLSLTELCTLLRWSWMLDEDMYQIWLGNKNISLQKKKPCLNHSVHDYHSYLLAPDWQLFLSCNCYYRSVIDVCISGIFSLWPAVCAGDQPGDIWGLRAGRWCYLYGTAYKTGQTASDAIQDVWILNDVDVLDSYYQNMSATALACRWLVWNVWPQWRESEIA